MLASHCGVDSILKSGQARIVLIKVRHLPLVSQIVRQSWLKPSQTTQSDLFSFLIKNQSNRDSIGASFEQCRAPNDAELKRTGY